ncbi:MAG: hypothetical protein IPH11_00600 [Ignavibacteriales bacterium]|nr:hypothetical protein [Ignavibacteriales bacterium]
MWGVALRLAPHSGKQSDREVGGCPSTPLCGASILILRQAPHSGKQDDRSPLMVAMPPLRVTGVGVFYFVIKHNCIV